MFAILRFIWNVAIVTIILTAFVRAIEGWWLLMKEIPGFIKMLKKGEYHA